MGIGINEEVTARPREREREVWKASSVSECRVFPKTGGNKTEGQSDFRVLEEECRDGSKTEETTDTLRGSEKCKEPVFEESVRNTG